MSRNHAIVNAILWATAMLAAAIVKAPTFLTVVLLPLLAAAAILFTRPPCRRSADRALRDLVDRANAA